jgi:hypothetical protein
LIAATTGFNSENSASNVRQEIAHVVGAAIHEAQEIDAGGKHPAGAGEDNRPIRRSPAFFELPGQCVAEFEVQRVGFAVRHPQDRDRTASGQLDHFACSWR